MKHKQTIDILNGNYIKEEKDYSIGEKYCKTLTKHWNQQPQGAKKSKKKKNSQKSGEIQNLLYHAWSLSEIWRDPKPSLSCLPACLHIGMLSPQACLSIQKESLLLLHHQVTQIKATSFPKTHP